MERFNLSPIIGERLDQLEIYPMVAHNTDTLCTALLLAWMLLKLPLGFLPMSGP